MYLSKTATTSWRIWMASYRLRSSGTREGPGRHPVARKDVEMLVRTYDLLDLLPRPQATVEFTQKTMATAKLIDLKPDVTQTAWYKQTQLIITAVASLAVLATVGSAGYLATTRWVPTDEDLLLRDLQVIKNLDEYSQVGRSSSWRSCRGSP